MKAFFSRVRDMWLIAGMVLLLFLLLEIAFSIYFRFNRETDPRIEADTYAQASWVTDYFTEFAACNFSEWSSYTYWRRSPFEGEYINVGNDHLRKTVFDEVPASATDSIYRIFVFGGSAVWGSGVRDAFTLPSLIGQQLSDEGYAVEVTNFGESGYVSTQEVQELMLQLQNQNIPDLVIFYDGANDVFSSLQQGKAGIPQNENNRQKEFNVLKSKKKALMAFFQSLSSLSTVRFVNQKFGSKKTHLDLPPEDSLKGLAWHTVDTYFENLHLITALGKAYGFRSLFYWQPVLYDKENRTAYEQSELDKMKYAEDFFKQNNRALNMRNKRQPDFALFNLNQVFSEEKKAIYIDWCHVGESGNTQLAHHISNDILGILQPQLNEPIEVDESN